MDMVSFVKERVELTETGLVWKSSPGLSAYWNNVIAGKPLSPKKDALGRLTVNLDQSKVYVASIVWALNFGEWHRHFAYADGDYDNTNITNLAPCDRDPLGWNAVLKVVNDGLQSGGRANPSLVAVLVQKSLALSEAIDKLKSHETFDPELNKIISELIRLTDEG